MADYSHITYSHSYSRYITPARLLTYLMLANKGDQTLHEEDIPVCRLCGCVWCLVLSVKDFIFWPVFFWISYRAIVRSYSFLSICNYKFLFHSV